MDNEALLSDGIAVGTALRTARTNAGLSVADLARRASTSRSAVHAYETGGREPGVATAIRLFHCCGRSLAVVEDRDGSS